MNSFKTVPTQMSIYNFQWLSLISKTCVHLRLKKPVSRNICIVRDIAKRGGEGAPPLVFSGPRGPKARQDQNSGGSTGNPHRSHEICAETGKKARQGPPEKQGPCDYQGLQ